MKTLLLFGLFFYSSSLMAFCGFFVAKADTKMFNSSSKVVLVRDQDRTVLTMANDYRGDPKEFAMVIPVPTVLKRKQINVGNHKPIEHLDQYTAPRLVEYFDSNPCSPVMLRSDGLPSGAMRYGAAKGGGNKKQG